MAKSTKADLEKEIEALKAKLKEDIDRLQSIIDSQTNEIQKLNNERVGVKQDVVDGIVKELERTKEARDDYKNLYEKSEKKRIELAEKYEQQTKSTQSVQKSKNERGAGRKPIEEGLKYQVGILKDKGYAIRKIAEMTGISVGTVHKIIQSYK